MSQDRAIQIPVDGSTAVLRIESAEAEKSGFIDPIPPAEAFQLSYAPDNTAAGAMAAAVAASYPTNSS